MTTPKHLRDAAVRAVLVADGVAPRDPELVGEWRVSYGRLVDAVFDVFEAQLVEAEAVIQKVRGLLRERTWAEALARDVTGAMFPQVVDMDDLRKILECSPSAVLADHDREVAARALDAAASEWHEPHDPRTYAAADWLAFMAVKYRTGEA